MFKDLKVVELAGVLAGPSVGMFFSELGAEVIKIENSKTGGDVTRTWKLASEDKSSPISAYFSSVNYKKRHLLKDLKNPLELTEIKTLIDSADILITNFKYGDDQKYGLDFNTLIQRNPKLIHGQITGFSGDLERVAFDLILQAESGIMSMNGQADGPPTKMPIALIDLLAGHQLKEGILCALLERGKTGYGKSVSVSLYDAAVASLANQATNWLMAGHIPTRMGSMHPNIAPYGELFTTKDGALITFAIGSDKQFAALCSILQVSWYKDSRFEKNTFRVTHRKELAKLMEANVGLLNFKELSNSCLKHQIPMAKIKNIKEVFEDESAQKLVIEEEQYGTLTKRVKTVVFK